MLSVVMLSDALKNKQTMAETNLVVLGMTRIALVRIVSKTNKQNVVVLGGS